MVIFYHKVQELRGNIRVFCRCRYDSSAACALKFDASGMVVCSTAQGRKKAYDFEKLFPPDTTQEEVRKIILAALKRYVKLYLLHCRGMYSVYCIRDQRLKCASIIIIWLPLNFCT